MLRKCQKIQRFFELLLLGKVINVPGKGGCGQISCTLADIGQVPGAIYLSRTCKIKTTSENNFQGGQIGQRSHRMDDTETWES